MEIKEKYKVESEQERVIKAYCDYCNKEFDKFITDANGYGCIRISFGFGSSFDESIFYLEICDDCFINNFGNKLIKQFEDKGYDMLKLNKDYHIFKKGDGGK